ncbi:Hypothetical protein, putative [Bodo saltans]|uniref:Uncharacterized protein n=1 Tax=Bodo saltans TaxID=75058 RepID=A0A0S4JEK8_BODSA|nr:Hypothetical protein, putative [Bodo saltans]|eukprot:CUG87856.1 Hypothetical protein, putative [Bodo saltans]
MNLDDRGDGVAFNYVDFLTLAEECEEMYINLRRWEAKKARWDAQEAMSRTELEELRRGTDVLRAENGKLRTAFAELAKNADAASVTQLSEEDESLLSSNSAVAVAASTEPVVREDIHMHILEVHKKLRSINRTNFSVFCGDVPKLMTEILPVLRSVKPDAENALALTLDIVEQLATCLSWACGVQNRGPSRGVSPPPALGPLPSSPTLSVPASVRSEKKSTSRLELPLPIMSRTSSPTPGILHKATPGSLHSVALLHREPRTLADLDASLPSPQPSPRTTSVMPHPRKHPTSPRSSKVTVPPLQRSLPTPLAVPSHMLPSLPVPSAQRTHLKPTSSPAPRLLLDEDDVLPARKPTVAYADHQEPAILVSRKRTSSLGVTNSNKDRNSEVPSELQLAPRLHDAVGLTTFSARDAPHSSPLTQKEPRPLAERSPNHSTPPLKRHRIEGLPYQSQLHQDTTSDLMGF